MIRLIAQWGIQARFAGALTRAACCVLALAFCATPLYPAFAQDFAQDKDEARDEEPVGWPLDKRTRRDMEIEQKRMPLPETGAATTRALEAWPSDQAGGNRNITTPPELAPLQRFTPEFPPRRIEYSGTSFALTIASAELLDQIAMRLTATGETIEIVAHSTGTNAGSDEGAAPLSTHEAVKLSFKRAMLIRLYLLDEGVRAGQIELRALPAADDGGPTERVDISIPDQKARPMSTEREKRNSGGENR